jgi:putative tricarboxylic transport membrane protein
MRKPGDIISSLFLILFGIVILCGAGKLGIGSVKEPQAGFFPFVGAMTLIVLSLLLLVQGLRGHSKGIQAFGDLLRPVLLIGGMLIYVFLFDPAGYIIATLILSAIVLRILDTKSWWVIGGVSLFLAFGTFVLFDRLLGMPLPDGILKGLF